MRHIVGAGNPSSTRPIGWWHLLALGFVVEVDVRRRPSDLSLDGRLDWWIWFELALCAVVGLRVVVRLASPRLDHPVVICLAGYAASSAATALYAPAPGLAIVRAGQLLVMLAALVELDRRIARYGIGIVHRMLHGFVAVTTVLIAVGMAERLLGRAAWSRRFSWLETHSVSSGAVLALSVVVLVGMCLAGRTTPLPWTRATYPGLLAVHAAALLLTRTRGSIAAAVIATLAMTLWWLRSRGRRDLLLALVLAVVGVGSTVAGPVVAYLLRSATTSELATLNSRTAVWQIAWRMIGERPLAGHGLTASRSAFVAETGLGGAHNAYLNLLVDVGLIGTVWWVSIVVVTLHLLGRLGRTRLRCIPSATAVPLAGRGDLAFGTVTISGLLICLLLNGLTAEWVGAGVSTSWMILCVAALWARRLVSA